MKAIVAVDLNWGIGYRGKLLERIPEDQRFFKRTTIGKVVVMGRETFESLPNKEPLKDRVNIVLSKNESFSNDQVIICRSLAELFAELKKYPSDDLFVIGGESVYTQLLPYCSEALVTKIENKYTADKYFINLDQAQTWELTSMSEMKSSNGLKYRFLKYNNSNCLP
ncbi:MAG: dihydrofolate reductase [Firmicutes bacterium]|nr:dihydrofolate reductase [Bacillota bacterium]